ncbi:integrase core domain-containing protein [Streptomyces sp. NPDC001142]
MSPIPASRGNLRAIHVHPLQRTAGGRRNRRIERLRRGLVRKRDGRGPNGTFKAELIEHQGSWRDSDQVEHALVQWVGRYNTERLHSALDYLPPDEFESSYHCSLAASSAG